MKFTKNGSITGKIKMLNVANGSFIDCETGEVIPVAQLIESAMGNLPFDLTVKSSTEEDVTPEKG